MQIPKNKDNTLINIFYSTSVTHTCITYILVLGQFTLSNDKPIQLKPGVSLHGSGSSERPTIFTGPTEANQTATIKGMKYNMCFIFAYNKKSVLYFFSV